MTLLEQLAQECFKAGRPLDELVTEIVEKKYNYTLNQVKALVREGKDFQTLRDALVADGFLIKTATSLALTGQEQVATEITNEERFKRATEEAIALYRNGVRHADVVNSLKGFAPDLAEKVAADNQHYSRSSK